MNRSVFASLVLAVAACGGSDTPKGTVDTANARTSVDQVGQVNVAMMSSNGSMAAGAVQAMVGAGQGIVTPAQAGRVVGLPSLEAPKPGTGIQNATGTADCTPTACTFTDYGDTGFMLNGTISKSGDTVAFDLTYDITTTGSALHWVIDGSVTVNATSIDGGVHSHGTSTSDQSGGYTITWDTDVDYNAIVLDGTGCPTAGSVHAVLSYDVSGAQGGGSYSAQGTASFGPACGQVSAN